MIFSRVACLALCLLFISVGILAKPNYPFGNVHQEQRFNHLIAQLRCLVCQNQSVADSNAPLAQDMRDKVFVMIQSGLSDNEINHYFVQRYGEYVLLSPKFTLQTKN